MKRWVSVILFLALAPNLATARRGEKPMPTIDIRNPIGPTDGTLSPEARFALAAANTTLLATFSFDIGATCSSQAWTVVDGTAQVAEFWHTDDFVGANINPGDSLAALAGSKSLWCGLRAGTSGLACAYVSLPGYGNNWDQLWQTKGCIPVSGTLDVSFLLEMDSEEYYDSVFLQYTTDCDANVRDWGWDATLDVWDGLRGPLLAGGSYPVNADSVRVRLRFRSDMWGSDEDNYYDSHAGPAIIDNLTVEGLPLETFEDEPVGATDSNDWEANTYPGYGESFMALFRGSSLQQQDPCAKNLSCMWSAINGSTETYACAGFPQQRTVPERNSDGQFIHAEIWSPSIPLAGDGSVVNVQFSVYRDLSIDALVFYSWDVRSIDATGCAGPWRSRGYLYGGNQRDWFVGTFPVGDLLDFSAAAIQVRLAVVDACEHWCDYLGSGQCHSHAPLYDNVRIYRVGISGPVWNIRDADLFQDTFPSDGTDTGIGRADAALNIAPWNTPTILPGDSVRIIVADPITATAANPSGLADDAVLGDKQVYLWVHVLDDGVPSPTKTGGALTDSPNYPFKDMQIAFGKTWTRMRCKSFGLPVQTFPGFRFIVDLNDNLFEAGDVVEFFFSATNASGETSYCSGPSLTFVQSNVELAAEVASEFSILPINGGKASNILYIDGMDGRGAQIYWDTAFEQLGAIADRYDVRAPTSNVANRPGSRVTNVAAQINANYRSILWDTGDLFQTLGDGLGANDKSPDYALLNSFLSAVGATRGVYLCGDDYPHMLNAATTSSAVLFKTTFITYSLVNGNHQPFYGLSPRAVGVSGGALSGDTFVIHGGCPLINDFDVMTPTGSSVKQLAYNVDANNAAVVSKVTAYSRVIISGFSFAYIRDDEEDGVMDRADHLHDILTYLGGSPSPPTDAPTIAFSNALEQNYPNPFNPQTSIAFSLKKRGHVRIDVYDVTGALVRTLVDETRAEGSYSDVRWDGHDRNGGRVASGVYFYKLVTDGFQQTRKMVLLK